MPRILTSAASTPTKESKVQVENENNIVKKNNFFSSPTNTTEWKGNYSPKSGQTFYENPHIYPRTLQNLNTNVATKGIINFKFISNPALSNFPSIATQIKNTIVKFCNIHSLASKNVAKFKSLQIYSSNNNFGKLQQDDLKKSMSNDHLLNNNQFTLYFTRNTSLGQKLLILKELDSFLFDELSISLTSDQINEIIPTTENFYHDCRISNTKFVSYRNEYVSGDLQLNLEIIVENNLASFHDKDKINQFTKCLAKEDFLAEHFNDYDMEREFDDMFNKSIKLEERQKIEQKLTHKFCYTFIKKYNDGKESEHSEQVIASLNRIMTKLIKLNPDYKEELGANIIKTKREDSRHYIEILKVDDEISQRALNEVKPFVSILKIDDRKDLLLNLNEVKKINTILLNPKQSYNIIEGAYKNLAKVFNNIHQLLLKIAQSNITARKQFEALLKIMKQNIQNKSFANEYQRINFIEKLFDLLEEIPEIPSEL